MILRTWMILWKEFIQIVRDPRTLAVVVILPVLMLALFGYAINLDVWRLRLGVYDQDGSQASRGLIGAFARSQRFDPTAHLTSYEELAEALDRGEVKAALVIPASYAEELASGMSAQVQLILDGSDSAAASTAIGYANAITQQHSAGLSRAALRRAGLPADAAAPPVDARVRYWYNPELRSSSYLVPGLIAIILMMLAALLTSLTVVRERERGTLEQLIVSPVRPHELMIGKLLPYLLIAFLDVMMVIAAGRLLFRVPLRGSPALLLALSAVFLTAALGIGLLVSTVSRSQRTAMTVGLLLTQVPSVLLSGFLFPVTAMPVPIAWLTNVIPARHFLVIARTIFLKGGGIAILWQPALLLLAFGVLMLGLSSARFRKKL